MLHIVLVEPEIPGNTGNVARLAAALGAHLHLVRPLGFATDDRALKRAGLDYWHLVKVSYHDSVNEVLTAYHGHSFHLATTKAGQRHTDASYHDGELLFFGKETAGLPEELLATYPERCIRIPMQTGARSLNLANSVAVVAYEALRQIGYGDLL